MDTAVDTDHDSNTMKLNTGLKAQRYSSGSASTKNNNQNKTRRSSGGGGGGKQSQSHTKRRNRQSNSPYKNKKKDPPKNTHHNSNSNCKVYVGNLSWDVSWQELKDYMRQCGEVLYANVMMDQDGRSKGCGIVEYSNHEEARDAMDTLTDTELNGRKIFVREDRENNNTTSTVSSKGSVVEKHIPTVNPACSVYVGNIAFDTTWQDLKDHMRLAGNVDHAHIIANSDGRPKGCAVVQYQHPKEANRAIRELQDSILTGRKIFVREDKNEDLTQHQMTKTNTDKNVDNTQIFVGNLSFDTTWQELKDLFKQCGHVEQADVIEGSDGRKRGFGIVRFFNSKDAQRSIQKLNNSDFMGRNIEVRFERNN